MARRKKEVDEVVISDINSTSNVIKNNILIDKGVSTQKYINEKVKYFETEGGIRLVLMKRLITWLKNILKINLCQKE